VPLAGHRRVLQVGRDHNAIGSTVPTQGFTQLDQALGVGVFQTHAVMCFGAGRIEDCWSNNQVLNIKLNTASVFQGHRVVFTCDSDTTFIHVVVGHDVFNEAIVTDV